MEAKQRALKNPNLRENINNRAEGVAASCAEPGGALLVVVHGLQLLVVEDAENDTEKIDPPLHSQGRQLGPCKPGAENGCHRSS